MPPSPEGAAGRVGWGAAMLTGAYAGALALLLMFVARRAWQVRTLPERIMEAVLRLVPPDQFEATIDRFGPAGKDYALYATTAGMFLALAVLGLLALRLLRRPAALLLLGLLLYLLTAAVIMPLTGAGFFAADLLENKKVANTVYFAVAMAYATALLLGRALALPRAPAAPAAAAAPASRWESRRALALGGLATLAGFLATVAFSRINWHLLGAPPLAALPAAEPTVAPQVAPPADTVAALTGTDIATGTAATTHSALAGAADTAFTSSAVAVGTDTTSAATAVTTDDTAAAPTPQATAEFAAPPTPATPADTPTPGYPEAPPERALARDKDGALLAVRRAKGELQPLVTPSADFYVVTKNAAGDPVLSARDWRLLLDGAVRRPVQVDYPTLRALPPVTVYKTLECISNLTAKCELTSFGCDLISTAAWTGARLADVLALAGGPLPGAVAIAAFGADEYSSALPAEAAADPNVLLVYQMNGAVLPREHGFPVRLLVPDHYGLKNAKWVVKVTAMTQPYTDWWGQHGWSHTAIVKTMSRIDVPVAGARLPAGRQRVAGIAYAGARGVAKVEYSADGGRTWHTAALTPGPGRDTFAQWAGDFALAAGPATLVCRATDGAGALQPQAFSLPQPDGGAGWDSIDVQGV